MPTDPTAAEHRRRADELRRYAAHLEATPLDDMLRWAGPDTWISPRADELLGELRADRGRLAGAVDDLRRHARVRRSARHSPSRPSTSRTASS